RVSPAPFLVSGGGQAFQTTATSARIGGLAPTTTYTFTIGRLGCPPQGNASITVTTAAGPAARPGTPVGLTVRDRSQTTVRLAWLAPPPGSDRATRYAVYDGGTRVATSTATHVVVRRLWRDTAHR